MNKLDILAIGDITTDAFIRIKDARVSCDINNENCQICMKFADKIPYESVDIINAVGNSPNAAVSVTRLGANASLVSNVGDDQNGKECLGVLTENGVSADYVKIHEGKKTNYHYVLWYEAERTILVKHEEFPYALPPKIPEPAWVYLSSLGESALSFHDEIETYLMEHPDVKLAFQPGTFQLKIGKERLAGIYKRTHVFVCNVEEARKILSLPNADIKTLLREMHSVGPTLVAITDGPKGAYASDGTHAWFMPIYPDPAPPLERTGCGDAFASTFVTALQMGKSFEDALMWAPINPMNVVQHVGAQRGLLTKEQLLELLSKAPANYKPSRIY